VFLSNKSQANVLVTITHAHSAGPAVVTNAIQYGNAAVRNYSSLGLAAVEAATLTLGNLKPAKVGYNTGEAFFNVNRDALDPLTGRWTQAANVSGLVDRAVKVLTFLGRDNNSPIASYTAAACTPSTRTLVA
jgi:neutral ceramidase